MDVGKIEFGSNNPLSGNYVYVPPQKIKCMACNGTGEIITEASCSPGLPIKATRLCQICEGKGYIDMAATIKDSQIYYSVPKEEQPILKVKVEEGGFLPQRAHEGDAGIDFFSPIDFSIQPDSDYCLPLNVRTAFDSGWVLWMAEKSGVSTKKKLDVGACIVDSGYRGIVHAHLFNNSNSIQSFRRGDKVVQGILVKCATSGQPVLVEDLDETDRGQKGFGSTDVKK